MKNINIKTVSVFFLLILACFNGFAQKKVSQKQSEIEKIKLKAKAWFKDYYVNLNFKDPYSYKLQKINVYPVTLKDACDEILQGLHTDSLVSDTTNNVDFKEKKSQYNRMLKYLPTDTSTQRYKDDLYTLQRLKEQIEPIRVKFNSIMADINGIRQSLKVASKSDLNKTHYHQIFLDCYSKNSFGNMVLGRFSFKYQSDGTFTNPESF
jgi:hypothetical protein